MMRVYLCLFGINDETVELALDITDWGCIPRVGETVWVYDDDDGMAEETTVSSVIYNPMKRQVIVELNNLDDVRSDVSEEHFLSAGWVNASPII